MYLYVVLKIFYALKIRFDFYYGEGGSYRIWSRNSAFYCYISYIVLVYYIYWCVRKNCNQPLKGVIWEVLHDTSLHWEPFIFSKLGENPERTANGCQTDGRRIGKGRERRISIDYPLPSSGRKVSSMDNPTNYKISVYWETISFVSEIIMHQWIPLFRRIFLRKNNKKDLFFWHPFANCTRIYKYAVRSGFSPRP